jgi:hypothetical protein
VQAATLTPPATMRRPLPVNHALAAVLAIMPALAAAATAGLGTAAGAAPLLPPVGGTGAELASDALRETAALLQGARAQAAGAWDQGATWAAQLQADAAAVARQGAAFTQEQLARATGSRLQARAAATQAKGVSGLGWRLCVARCDPGLLPTPRSVDPPAASSPAASAPALCCATIP